MEQAERSPEAAQAAKKADKVLDRESLAAFDEQNARKGVCYISRVPPYMKPSKLRHLLSGLGTDVLRIYLTPEDKTKRVSRLRAGGNRKRKFVEGWVEFADKKVAKRIAASLNNTPVDRRTRSFYASDLWSIKYLSKFKWQDLTARLAYERKVKEQKLRLEFADAKRENAFYLQKVNQAKAIDAMERKAAAKAARTAAGDDSRPAGDAEAALEPKRGLKAPRRGYAQRRVLDQTDDGVAESEVLSRVLATGEKRKR